MRRRLVLIGILLIAAIAGADWLVIGMQRDASIDAYRVALTNLSNGMAAQTALPLAAIDAVLQDLRDRLAPATAAGDAQIQAALASPATFALLAQYRQRLAWTDALVLVGADGRVANSTRARPPPAADPSDAEAIRTLALRPANTANEAAFIGRPHQDPASGRWTAALARRLTDAQGDFAGVVLAEVSLTDFADFYRTALPPHRTITILRRDGVVLLRYPAQAGVIGRAPPLASPVHALIAAGRGGYIAPDAFDHVPRLGVMRQLGKLPLFSEAAVTEAEVLDGWRRQRVWLIGGGIAAASLVAGLVWLFGRQIARLGQRNAELEHARRQFDAALSNISQGVSFFSPDQRLILCNRRFGEIYLLSPDLMQPGTTLAEMIDRPGGVARTPDFDRDAFLAYRAMISRSGLAVDHAMELTDGRIISVHEQPLPDGGFVATHEDITERRRAEERIAFLAHHDTLTGLPNRSLLMERISQERSNVGRGGFALLFLDLDRFKMVNDTLGHRAGDELLRAVTQRLLALVRPDDTVARLGGDEFVVLLLNPLDPHTPAALAERIIARVGEPYGIAGNTVTIGVSVGIDVATTERTAAADVLKNADMALYAAKQDGRGTFRFFEPEMDARVRRRHALETDLQNALTRGEFELEYQPIVNVGSGTAYGFEALIRWNHPARGRVSPADFIPVAEECGLIIPIGDWAVRTACQAAAGWPDDIHVSINLSAVQFRAANLVDMVRAALADAGLPGRRVELEVTETVLLDSNECNLAVMHQLRAVGIGMVMDDFGIGYSSLSYLRRFPFDRIKIDQSFVREITTSDDAIYVIRAIVGLCRNLGIRTTAEGVETAAQLATLVAEGCTELQGYLFDRPVPLTQVGRLIGARLIAPAQRAGGAVLEHAAI